MPASERACVRLRERGWAKQLAVLHPAFHAEPPTPFWGVCAVTAPPEEIAHFVRREAVDTPPPGWHAPGGERVSTCCARARVYVRGWLRA